MATVEASVPCTLDFPHPAGARWREDSIGPEPRSGSKGHTAGNYSTGLASVAFQPKNS
jgi:hypothetical protein